MVRVVGYVREAPDPREGEPAFAQTERIRRWAGDSGHHLVAVCQDVRTARDSDRREGLRAVLGILAEGAAAAVVVPDLATLSADKIVQEIMIRDLRGRGATVISAAEEDLPELEEPTSDRLRSLVRHVLLRLEEHEARFADTAPGSGDADEPDQGDVIVELISPEPPEPFERIRPVR